MGYIGELVRTHAEYTTAIQHRLLGGTTVRVEAKNDRERTVIFSQKGTPPTRMSFKTADLPWLVCNPYRLVYLAGPRVVREGLTSTWKTLDSRTSNPAECAEQLGQLALFENEADVSYLAIYYLYSKLLERKIPRDKIPEAMEKLKAVLISAFAEGDVPKIAFINGYLVQLREHGRKLGVLEELDAIESLYPTSTTENLMGSGNYSHLILR